MQRRRRRLGGSDSPPPMFPSGGLLSGPQSLLDNQSMITASTGTITQWPDRVTLGASSSITYGGFGPKTGNFWITTVVDMVVDQSGAYRPRWLNPTYNPEALRSREGYMTWKFPSVAASTDLNFLTGAGFLGDLLGMQVYDMAAILAQPADVYIAAGQSNMACTDNSFGIDMQRDVWMDRRILYFPQTSQASYGAVAGQPHACVPPLHTNGQAAGVSPAYTFVNDLLSITSAGRNIVLIQAAQGGTGLVAPDAAWNSRGSSPTAYNACVSQVNTAMAALPVGSTIKGVLWAQGESDSVAALPTYPGIFANMRSDMETAISSGQVPWILLLPPPDASRPNQQTLIDMQTKMDVNSGDATAQPKLYVVARSPGYMEDTTHTTAAGQRDAGRKAAAKFKTIP